MIKIMIISAIVSFVISFSMMKFQIKMLTKWMDDFYDKQKDRMVSSMTEKANLSERRLNLLQERNLEKISLDIPPVVVFEGEEWNVGTIDHHENTVNIFRNTSIKRKEYTYYDIETKTVNASELYKADTRCMPLKKLDDFMDV